MTTLARLSGGHSWARLVSIGLAAGLLAGLMGVGGGVLMVPAMVYLLGYSQHEAHGTSLAIMVLLATVAAASYGILGAVNWLVAVTLIPGGMLGAFAGARVTRRLPALQLKAIFSVFVLLTGMRMMAGGNGAPGAALLDGAGAALAGLGMGLVSGFLAGLLGIGGGIVMVPVMVLLLGITQQTAQGTSLVAIVPTAISGARTHYRLGHVDLGGAAGLALGGIPGSIAGSRIANALNAGTLKGVFGAFLLVMSVLMLLQTQAAIRKKQTEAAAGEEETVV
ncbi:MAG: sulfite exporter TauE/SafE family protein [Armatimonadota bacterium]